MAIWPTNFCLHVNIYDPMPMFRHESYFNALLGQDVANVHLAAAVVAPCLAPELGSMGSKRLPNSSDDAFVFGQELANKLEADAPASS